MEDFARILVPVDGSDSSAKAVARTVKLARICGSTIDFLYVANITGVTGGLQLAPPIHLPDDVLAKLKDAGNAAMDKVLAQVPDDLPTQKYCETGSPAETILAFAEKHDNDLIVVGSRGLTAAEGIWLGSVSRHLVERAQCPVMVVK